MKLTPFESAFERVAERILRKHKKELEAYVTLFYSRAVGQAVEFLEAKTSPAKKANKTRKNMDAMRRCLEHVYKTLNEGGENDRQISGEVVNQLCIDVYHVLHPEDKGGEA